MRRVVIFLSYFIATLCLGTLGLVGMTLSWCYRSQVQGEMVYGNCWSFAVGKWLKDPRYTYLVVRMSRHANVPHVMFSESMSGANLQEFVPLKPQYGFKGFIDSLWFKGHVRKGLE